MTVGEPKNFVAAVALGESTADLTTALPPGSGSVERRYPPVCDTMAARLTGQGFDIELLTADIAQIPVNGTGDWEWQVTPREAGEKFLTLRLYAQDDRDDVPLNLKTYHEDIEVEVNQRARLAALFTNWLIPIGAIPAFFVTLKWLYPRIRKRFDESNTAHADVPENSTPIPARADVSHGQSAGE